MAHELGVDVHEVAEGGTALAFIAYPTVVAKGLVNRVTIAKVPFSFIYNSHQLFCFLPLFFLGTFLLEFIDFLNS